MKNISGAPTASVIFYSTVASTKISAKLGDPNSDILSINIQKSLKNPTGTWNINLVPRTDSYGRTFFDKLNVWDYVEIKLKGANNDEEKIVMRGLVDNIQKSEYWLEGVPRRSITVSGRDLGALFTDFQIYYMPELGETEAIKSELKALAWKIDFPITVNAQEAFDFLFEEWMDSLDLYINNQVHMANKIRGEAESLYPEYRTNLFFLMSYEGPWWNAFEEYQDRPFHELFLYDADDLCYFILRPSRLKDVKGRYHPAVNNLLSNTRMYPKNFKINAEDKISITVQKSAAEIYNFYITIPTAQLLSKEQFRMLCMAENTRTPKLSINPYFALNESMPSYVKKFGFRKLEAQTVFCNLDEGQIYDGKNKKKPNETYVSGTLFPDFVKRGKEMNRWLVNWFLHNPLLLSGQIDIRGINDAIIGTYVLDNDENGIEYYVEEVIHNFVTLQNYTTTLGVSRGMKIDALDIPTVEFPDRIEEKDIPYTGRIIPRKSGWRK